MYSESEKRISVPESYLLRLQSQARTAGTRVHDGMPSPAETTATEVEWAFPGTDNWVLCQPGQYHYMGNSSSTYIANRLNPTTETLAWHNYPHCKHTRSSNPMQRRKCQPRMLTYRAQTKTRRGSGGRR